MVFSPFGAALTLGFFSSTFGPSVIGWHIRWVCALTGGNQPRHGRSNSWSKIVTKYASLLWLTGEISSTNLVRYLWGMSVAITIKRGSKEELFKSTSNWDPGWCLTSTVSTKIRNQKWLSGDSVEQKLLTFLIGLIQEPRPIKYPWKYSIVWANVWLALLGINNPVEVYSAVHIYVFFNLSSE